MGHWTQMKRATAGPSRKAHPDGCSQKPVPANDLPETNSPVSFAPDAVGRFIQELQHSMGVVLASIEEAPTPIAPLLASSDWSTRNHSLLERWRAERPRLINSIAASAHVGADMCQQCAVTPAAVCCHGCEPRPFLCPECDIKMHTDTRNVLHNRDAMTAGFFHPLPPTTCIIDKSHCCCERFVPVRIPEQICCGTKESLRINPGKAVAVVTIDDSLWDLSEDGVKGLQSIILSKQWKNNKKMMMRSQERYLHVLTGAENVTFLEHAPNDDEDDYNTDSDLSEEDLE